MEQGVQGGVYMVGRGHDRCEFWEVKEFGEGTRGQAVEDLKIKAKVVCASTR
jgi:hypothetical protein